MGSPVVPARTLVTLRLLQTSCGLLVVASLVALGQPTPVIVAHDGAAPVASVRPAVPTEWSPPGPLRSTIGVVPPGSENWFDPDAEPTFEAPRRHRADRSRGPPLDERTGCRHVEHRATVPDRATRPSPPRPRGPATETSTTETPVHLRPPRTRPPPDGDNGDGDNGDGDNGDRDGDDHTADD